MPDRRLAQRWSRRVKVRFWKRGAPEHVETGFTTNLSDIGAFIETTHPLSSGVRLQIEFATDQGGFLMESQVARAVKTPFDLRQVRPSGMGVRFVPVRELLAEIMPLTGDLSLSASSAIQGGRNEKTSSAARRPSSTPPRSDPGQPVDEAPRENSTEAETPRKNPARFHPAASPVQRRPGEEDSVETEEAAGDLTTSPPEAAPPTSTAERVFTIRFRDLERLRRVWLEELQYGGLFIPTQSPLAVDSLVDLRVFLPQDEESTAVRARVVLVNQADSTGSERNLLTGMGVRLSHPEPLFAKIRPLLRSSR